MWWPMAYGPCDKLYWPNIDIRTYRNQFRTHCRRFVADVYRQISHSWSFAGAYHRKIFEWDAKVIYEENRDRESRRNRKNISLWVNKMWVMGSIGEPQLIRCHQTTRTRTILQRNIFNIPRIIIGIRSIFFKKHVSTRLFGLFGFPAHGTLCRRFQFHKKIEGKK